MTAFMSATSSPGPMRMSKFMRSNAKTDSFDPCAVGRTTVTRVGAGRAPALETAVVVRDGENGVLIPPDELGSLPRVLVGLLSNDGDRRALGEAGRRSADERLPTVEERQVMEVEAAERAVREHRSRDGASGDRKDAA